MHLSLNCFTLFNRFQMDSGFFVIRVDHFEENFPKSILTFYGWENASGSAFIKSKNSKDLPSNIEEWHCSFKLDLPPAQ